MAWVPVENGVYGDYDTVQVDGGALTVNSAYGNGQKRNAMIPLPNDLRLCRHVPDAPAAASVPSREVVEAIGYCWRWAQVWSEKGGADSDERYAWMNKQVDIVHKWLATLPRE